ncbi:MAG: hypothetical protein OSJ24_03995 [Muribaculaceae bacterium]|nr:hypothetical protein [Muribaculaceae bacterium]
MLKNRRSFFMLIMCVAVMLLCGCNHSRISKELDRAEAVMESHPDSALNILQLIDASDISGETRARHALLLSQAYDKNYIDLTSDSLISIATSYYNRSGNTRLKMMASYYYVAILMNRRDFDKALSIAFDVEKLAEESGDIDFLARIRNQIARAYLFSFNQEGAKDYLEKSLELTRSLNKPEWTGNVFINLANWALYHKDHSLAIEYVDSAKNYIATDPDIAEYEMMARIGLADYDKADSIYCNHIALNTPSTQARAYNLLTRFQLGRQTAISDSLTALMAEASHFDSIDIAYVGAHISRLDGNYERAWFYTDLLLQECSSVITDISNHSLYRIQLEHDKLTYATAERNLQNRLRISIFAGLLASLIIMFGIIYFRMVRKRHEEQVARAKDDILLVLSEYSDMRANLKREIDNQKQEVATLTRQIQAGHLAARQLFTAKYAWIEELGNLMIDTESSKLSSEKALQKIKQRLDSVKTKKFTSNLIDVVNSHCNNIIDRVARECPAISDSEQTILALLYADLSPRIISFILNIKPQSIYNAKSSIKHKLEKHAPALLHELKHIFP